MTVSISKALRAHTVAENTSMADNKVTEQQSLGDKITACFKDVFKSCYNFDKKNKIGESQVIIKLKPQSIATFYFTTIDYGERKSAKLDLIEVPDEKGFQTQAANPLPPRENGKN